MPAAPLKRDRYEATAFLTRPVRDARFVDGKRAAVLAKRGIATVGDLVTHFPARYLDMSAVPKIRDAAIGEECTVVGRIHEIVEKRPRPRMSITEITLFDGTGIMLGVWFRQPWIAAKYKVGDSVAFSGKVTFDYGAKRMSAPFVEMLGEDTDRAGRILPIHPTSEGLSTNWLRRLIASAIEDVDGAIDFLPQKVRTVRGLMRLDSALRAIHFPDTMVEADEARRRFAYSELFLLQLFLGLRREALGGEGGGRVHTVDGKRLALIREGIPFTLTDDQKRATDEILADMGTHRPMNRMLLGDVGTGKTLVAAQALAAAVDSSGQAVMMAPTEVLARQYETAVGPLLDAASIPWASLSGSTPAARRKEVLQGLATGSISVVFGTHALLEGDVEFADLSLVIVDEQHRFGVNQRLALRGKGSAPDTLVMTATPIPRTLALTLYGDLDISYLRERPGNRPPVTTSLTTKNRTGEAYERVREVVDQGRQAYIVVPLVGVVRPKSDEETREVEGEIAAGHDLSDLKAAIGHAEFLQKKVFPHHTVGLLTGRMRPKEKADIMDRFRAGEIDILVSTTVIEVGVDVPNASIMLIEDAERFGLAQLHQLRGRVGRGDHPGEVVLFADSKSPESRARMRALVETSDGFELAEYDLRLRREGDILGDRQHGLPSLKLTGALTDTELIEVARRDARGLLAADPALDAPEHGPLKHELERTFADAWKWVSAG